MKKYYLTTCIFLLVSNAIAGSLQGQDSQESELFSQRLEALLNILSADKLDSFLRAQSAWEVYRDKECQFHSAISTNKPLSTDEVHVVERFDRSCFDRLTRERRKQLTTYTIKLSREERNAKECEIKNLPNEFTIQSVGVYHGGINTDVRLEDSGNVTKAVDVIVNKPNENVVVVLSAYDPVVWNLKKTRNTKIVGVVVGGYHNQAVLGIARDVPLFITTYEGRRDCDHYFYGYKAGSRLVRMNSDIKEIAGREIDYHWGGYSAKSVVLGEPVSTETLVSSDDHKIEDYTNLPRFTSGQKGIEELIELGKLRHATSSDISAWVETASKRYRKFNPELKVRFTRSITTTYVVLDKIRIPDGLFGGHSVAFILPSDVPVPDGHLGHSSIYYLKDGTCDGFSCVAESR